MLPAAAGVKTQVRLEGYAALLIIYKPPAEATKSLKV